MRTSESKLPGARFTVSTVITWLDGIVRTRVLWSRRWLSIGRMLAVSPYEPSVTRASVACISLPGEEFPALVSSDLCSRSQWSKPRSGTVKTLAQLHCGKLVLRTLPLRYFWSHAYYWEVLGDNLIDIFLMFNAPSTAKDISGRNTSHQITIKRSLLRLHIFIFKDKRN